MHVSELTPFLHVGQGRIPLNVVAWFLPAAMFAGTGI